MTLVDYPSSDEDEAESAQPEASTLKRKREEAASDLPPLPSKFHDLYASTVRTSVNDDPTLHGGRKRAAPHVEGNWPSHVYIEWYPLTAEFEIVSDIIQQLRNETASLDTPPEIHSFLSSELGVQLPLHISLSRPIVFSTSQKDAFVTSLIKSVNSSAIRPFDISFSSLDWVANFEKTRWFLVLRVRQPEQNGLNRVLHVTNTVVQQHGQPPLYINPKSQATQGKRIYDTKRGLSKNIESTLATSKLAIEDASTAFHVSIAWMLEAPSHDLLEMTAASTKNCLGRLDTICMQVESVKSKVGNVVTNVPLPTKAFDPGSLFSS